MSTISAVKHPATTTLMYNSLLYGKNETPFMSLLTNIKKYYKTLEVI